jgi:hypothetical protein
MSTNKEKIKKITTDLLKQSYEEAVKRVTKAIDSGALDVSSWDENHNPMLAPKAIVIAVLQEEAEQYSAKGTSFEKEIKKNAKNIRLFL